MRQQLVHGKPTSAPRTGCCKRKEHSITELLSFPADQYKSNKSADMPQLLLNCGTRFAYKSIWQKFFLSHYFFLPATWTFNFLLPKSYGKINIWNAAGQLFVTWNNIMNSSLAAVFQMLELGKQAKYDNSQEGGAEVGKEVMQLRGFCTVRRRAELKKTKKTRISANFTLHATRELIQKAKANQGCLKLPWLCAIYCQLSF